MLLNLLYLILIKYNFRYMKSITIFYNTLDFCRFYRVTGCNFRRQNRPVRLNFRFCVKPVPEFFLQNNDTAP